MASRARPDREPPLLPVATARARFARAVRRLRRGAERVPTTEALGRVIGGPARAPRSLPPFATSAMDGYAVRPGPGGAVLFRLRGRALAGEAAGPALKSGEARRVATGAPVPTATVAVVPDEEAEREGDLLRARRTPVGGAHVRRAGEDVRRGAPLLHPGRVVRPFELALRVGAGVRRVQVVRRPVIALLPTGDELARAARRTAVCDAVSPALAALRNKLRRS